MLHRLLVAFERCVIDFVVGSFKINFKLICLPEDNNTRVLFERVLSSGGLTPALSVEVWNRFLEFESNIGDLASIVKVERRRSAVLENVGSSLMNYLGGNLMFLSLYLQLKEYEGKETAQLVDRYKFLDLYPCSPVELRSIGYSDVSLLLFRLISALN